MKRIIDFLNELQQNNHREWFNTHRDWYEECREKVLLVTELLINEIRRFDEDIPVTAPEDCLFRIYRDVRFSSDKRPYKTHFGSYIAKGGRKSIRAGYYFHIEPGGSFIGGGIYMPDKEVLRALRTAIYDHPEVFTGITGSREFRNHFPEIEGEKLKNNPKGFSNDFEFMELLKYKSYVFSKKIPAETLATGDFVKSLLESFRVLYPVNRFLNDAIDNYL